MRKEGVMHPVMTMRNWAHVHHLASRHEIAERLSQWRHSEQFWPEVVLFVAVGIMISLMILAAKFGPLSASTPMYSSPYLPWLH